MRQAVSELSPKESQMDAVYTRPRTTASAAGWVSCHGSQGLRRAAMQTHRLKSLRFCPPMASLQSVGLILDWTWLGCCQWRKNYKSDRLKCCVRNMKLERTSFNGAAALSTRGDDWGGDHLLELLSLHHFESY
jgi:hypothetical protein